MRHPTWLYCMKFHLSLFYEFNHKPDKRCLSVLCWECTHYIEVLRFICLFNSEHHPRELCFPNKRLSEGARLGPLAPRLRPYSIQHSEIAPTKNKEPGSIKALSIHPSIQPSFPTHWGVPLDPLFSFPSQDRRAEAPEEEHSMQDISNTALKGIRKFLEEYPLRSQK